MRCELCGMWYVFLFFYYYFFTTKQFNNMRTFTHLLSSFILLFLPYWAAAQCGVGQSLVKIVILTDNYPAETNWQLRSADNSVSYANSTSYAYTSVTLYSHTFCVPSTTCNRFRMGDSFGDGMCCTYGNGYFAFIVDGDTLARDSNFTRELITDFNCPQGSVCNNPDTITTGNFSTTYDAHWYSFTPAVTGMYSFSTCGNNTCDTKIWIYDNCSHNFDSTNVGTLYYNDNFCNLQSRIDASLRGGETFLIRVGDRGASCTGSLNFAVAYNGAVSGCTDSTACNYNPLATVSDTCIYFGSPNCPNGPDLLLRQDVLRNSLQLVSYNSTDPCLATEECVSGMGLRDIIRFSTHIENNGNRDYFIGVPQAGNPQFTYGNCHNHWHYQGYAQYLLVDAQGNFLPIGMKNGFCVLDLVCDNGGVGQYGCGNMGITAGCGDIYDRSLQCQWVDVTNVADGDYQLLVRVNWDYSPDATGAYEMDYNNNWGNVCINLSRSTGNLQMTVLPNCSPYVDCMGVAFGSATIDCDGACNGTGIRGDMNANQTRERADVRNYLQHICAQDLNATECKDLHRDTTLNIYDAALLQRCLNDSARCNFPTGLYNSVDTVGLSIIQVVPTQNNGITGGYVDIGIRNPTNKVTAYQFSISGFALEVDSTQQPISLVDSALYPVQIVNNGQTNIIAALSPVDSAFNRSFSVQPLCRVYFKVNVVDAMSVCIDSIYSVVSDNFQALATKKEGACYETINTNKISANNFPALQVKVAPNPFKNNTVVSFENNIEPLRLQLFDALGALVQQEENVISRTYTLSRNNLATGIYFLKISGNNSNQTVKIVIE
jgi:Lysyl oxidase/Secretion system C-terminal sorting domain